jgi:oligopeptide/dipeptide ABC transporter ATP-binding protein
VTALLDVRNLSTHYFTRRGLLRAVDDVSFTVAEGRTVAIVGESGSGKSVTALSLMRLVPDPPGRIVAGSVLLDGVDLLRLSEAEMRHVRGARVGMIFQEPMTSLNPTLSIGVQLCEGMEHHLGLTARQAEARAIDLLGAVGIAEPTRRLRQYPHQFSGGMRQRIVIAIALACAPRLLIADEPTTALDVTIQAQILDLIAALARDSGTAVIMITHDLGVVARCADEVNVMYAGRFVEKGTAGEVFARPRHPYTRGLLASVPRLTSPRGQRMVPIEGTPPDLARLPSGCAFRLRCPLAEPRCAEAVPPLLADGAGHAAACWVTGGAVADTAQGGAPA